VKVRSADGSYGRLKLCARSTFYSRLALHGLRLFYYENLIIGDVVAKPGRIAVLERVQDLREQHEIDLAIMNAENLAGGFSVTPSLCEQLFASGIDVMTSGNHIFDKKEAIEYIRKQPS